MSFFEVAGIFILFVGACMMLVSAVDAFGIAGGFIVLAIVAASVCLFGLPV